MNSLLNKWKCDAGDRIYPSDEELYGIAIKERAKNDIHNCDYDDDVICNVEIPEYNVPVIFREFISNNYFKIKMDYGRIIIGRANTLFLDNEINDIGRDEGSWFNCHLNKKCCTNDTYYICVDYVCCTSICNYALCEECYNYDKNEMYIFLTNNEDVLLPNIIWKTICDYDLGPHTLIEKTSENIKTNIISAYDWIFILSIELEEDSIYYLLNCNPKSYLYGYVYRHENDGNNNFLMCHIKEFLLDLERYVYITKNIKINYKD